MKSPAFVTAVAIALAVSAPAAAQQDQSARESAKIGLEFLKDLPLPGSASRLDYQSIDAKSRRLFIAHLGADQVTVVDIDSLKVVSVIAGIAKPHGILAIPELGQVYVSATGTDEVAVIDERSLMVVARIAAGHYPDGIAFDPAAKRVFVSDETGKTVAVIDAATQRLLRLIALGSEVGNTHYDPAGGMVYSAAQSTDELVEIDPEKLELKLRYKLPGCGGPHGFLIDAATHSAFITGEDNATYVVFNLSRKEIIASGRVGSDPDVVDADTAMHRLYVSSESGTISSFDIRPGGVHKAGEAYLAPNAHTVCVDQKTHLIFFPLKDVGGKPVLRVMKPIQ